MKLKYLFLATILFSNILQLAAQSGISANLNGQASRFPGGEEALYKYLSDNISYPLLLIKIEMEGEVDVKFTINEKGNTQNIEIVRGFDPLADDEVIRVLKTMPKWAEGENAEQELKITFTLNDHLRDLLNKPQEEKKPQKKEEKLEVKEITPPSKNDDIAAKTDTLLNKDPQFPGGREAMEAYFKKNMKYPKRAKELGIEGRVLFNITVSPEGEITEIRIFKGIFPECNEEAYYLIKKMPKWIPGLKDGKPASLRVMVPVPFELN